MTTLAETEASVAYRLKNHLGNRTTSFAKRHDTPHGQMAMQVLHDGAARGGAVCSAGNAAMTSRHEATGLQAVHDLTVEHGASCKPGMGMSAFSGGSSKPPTTTMTEARRRELLSYTDTGRQVLATERERDPAVFAAAGGLAAGGLAVEDRRRLLGGGHIGRALLSDEDRKRR